MRCFVMFVTAVYILFLLIYTSYLPSFFPSIYGPSTKRAGHKRGSVTYGTDREDEVSEIFIISQSFVYPKGSGTISIHEV